MKEYPTQPGKEGKLEARIVHTVRVKIRHRNFSNNAVPDMNENISGSTDLAQKWHGSVDLRTSIHPPLYSILQYSPKIMHAQELLFASARRSSSCG